MSTDWLGNVRGHVGEANKRFDADGRRRTDAEVAPKSTILSDRMLKSGLDAGKVLHTTLNGGLTEITANELATFRHNMQLAKKQAGFKGKGITARQVIDLASSTPLSYAHGQPGGARSDIDKARKEITMGVPVSALHDTVRFITNASPGSKKARRHHVVIQLLGFRDAADSIIASGDDPAAPRKAADKMRKAGLKFDCSCERHTFFLRYVATIGGFNAGRDETGFPKIRNPGLKGVACKHVLRVMTELESSNAVLSFLERHLQSVSAYKANTSVKQAEVEKVAQAKKEPTRIKTSEQRRAEAAKTRERRAIKVAAKAAPRPKVKRTAATRRIEAAFTSGEITELDLALLRKFGLSDSQIAAKLKNGSA